MNKQERFVITISRQFGTGGHEIGAELARRLGVKLLDKQIINEVASKFCVVEDAVEKIESRNPLWRDDFTQFYRLYMAGMEYDGQEQDQTSHKLFDAQAEAICQIASQESCVIIGRSGFHIFRNHPYAMRIFFIADRKARVKRIMEKFALDEDAASMRIDKIDEARDTYTQTVAGVSRYDARNYDFVFNVTQFPTDLVAQFLADNIRKKYPFIVK